MTLNREAQEAVGRYDLGGNAEIVRPLQATHAAFQVSAGNRVYALRQFNPYMDVEDLRTQFRFTELMRDAGLRTPVPIPTKDGEVFVEVAYRLWALFPWCDGRLGQIDRVEDLSVIASIQGTWVKCCEHLRLEPDWETIVCTAQMFRQRKSWAWIVPLDQVPRFVKEHRVIQKARGDTEEGPYRKTFLDILPEVYANICKFEELLKEQKVYELPHTVTHGDFWASNVILSDGEAVVLDLDCFSFEPRIADFARAANWYYQERSASENADLFRRFQERARLHVEEAEALPLMMCAHDLYYAVGHVLLFLDEEGNPDGQKGMIEAIQSEMKAPERYQYERDRILRMFLKDE